MGRTTLACLAALTALAAAACSNRQEPQVLGAGEGVSVDVATLWKKEAQTDPITAYKVRLASDPDNAGLHNNLGNQYVLENRIREALREYRKAADLDRGSPVPWNNMGTTYRTIGKLDKAMEAFQKALSIDDRYALAYYNLGTIHDQKGDYDEAIAQYLKAMALNPGLADVRTNPQIVNNRNLMVVKLRHWLEESGNIGLPLDRLPE